MKIAYVICVNDSTKAVVIDDEKKAEIEMKKLKEKHRQKSKWDNNYIFVYNWYLREVPIL